jgi:hypothetical protein
MPLTDDPWLFTDASGNVPTIRRGAVVAVFRFDRSTFTSLPNVECLSIAKREGTDPGSARFRYNLASGLNGAPVSIETALGTQFSGGLVVNAGDQLVVTGTRPDGVAEFLFHGEAVEFGMGLDPVSEDVFLGAVGIGWRAWDDVIGGAILRDAGTPRALGDVPTDLAAQFNPEGLPNCTPDNFMSGSIGANGDFRYPVFLDPLVIGNPDARTPWTLPKACRYILNTANKNQKYVKNPDGGYLDQILVSPNASGDQLAPINCPDTPITGKDWPVTVNRLVSECGFGTSFNLSADSNGLPTTAFAIYKAQAGPTKHLYLAARGTRFDPTLFNVQGSGLSRDVSGVVSQWTVVGGADRYEASFILMPGFKMAAGDKTATALKAFYRGQDAYTTANRYAYRLYILDECGEGFYAFGQATPTTNKPPSLDILFGAPAPGTGKASYARRRRPGIGKLISIDPNTGKALEARLSISTNYDPGGTKSPGLWDGTGTWQPVTSTTWRLLDDRLGIEITDSNPNDWEIGKSAAAGMPYTGGVVNGVEAQATAVAGKNFWLRLTCVVEADHAMKSIATPRGGSPLARTTNRVIDASDRYRREILHYPSEFLPTTSATQADQLKRDDSAAALAEAQAIRAGTESGVLEGPVTIPRLTTYYKIGDRIDSIEGRGLGLRTDQGTGSPVFPVVIAVRHDFSPESQSTTIELSDAGTDRTKYDRAAPRESPAYVKPVKKKPDLADYDANRLGTLASNKAKAGGYVPQAGDEESPW